MDQRHTVLNLDEDIAEALEVMGERSLSAAANAALRKAVQKEAHHRALREWLDELDAKYGAPTAEDLAAADEALDELERGHQPTTPAFAMPRVPDRCYDVYMSKRRITLNLDEDIVEALEVMGERSLSAAANAALRKAVQKEAHHRALLEWLDELDAKYGAPTEEQLAAADTVLDEFHRGKSTEADAA